MLISAPGASDRGCSVLLGNLGQSLLVELRGPQALLPSLSAGPQGICRPPPRWVPLSCPIGGCWLVPGPTVQGPWGYGHLCVGPHSNAPGQVLTRVHIVCNSFYNSASEALGKAVPGLGNPKIIQPSLLPRRCPGPRARGRVHSRSWAQREHPSRPPWQPLPPSPAVPLLELPW